MRNGASLLGVDKLTLENSTDSGKSRGPNFKWVCRQKAVDKLTLIFLSFFYESFYFFLETLILRNDVSLLGVDKFKIFKILENPERQILNRCVAKRLLTS